MKKLLLTILVAAPIVLSGCLPKPGEVSPPPISPPSEVVDPAPEAIAESEGFAQYYDYSIEKLAELNGREPFVLFFHATWCPRCRVTDADIKMNLLSLKGPVLKVNYDKETDLKKQYGVTVQSTLVFVDRSGTAVDTKIDGEFEDIQTFFSN